ncbi:pyruvate kinase [Methylosarcina fibrata]|uniref:pyruvate kinase n=1 Tax=Methylosarcina fibrata TaxID=105972 RepID=UPI00036F7712|nr:pyruvate kinase [Methylosarcina fibrata]
MNSLINSDPYNDILKQLLKEVSELRRKVETHANSRLHQYRDKYRDGVFTRSACNLAHYLALRQNDLRNLQDRLAQAGLSSLGRAEASVISTLDALIDILKRATDEAFLPGDKNPSEFGFTRGHQLLEQHAIELFGPFHEQSKAHVMVTLSTDAAWDYELVHALLEKGMTCARINCAHDDPVLWQAMIRNIRRAETESGKSCRVLMDLAGHKIRTGSIEQGPAVHHIKIKRDASGQCISPGYLVLASDETCPFTASEAHQTLFKITVPQTVFEKFSPGFILTFTDARGKERHLLLEKSLSEAEWLASCPQSSYLASGCESALYESAPVAEKTPIVQFNLGEFSGASQIIRLFKNDLLLLTDNIVPGGPARYDENGIEIAPAHIGCTLSSFIDRLKVGQPVWIDDGKIGAMVEGLTEQGALLRVTQARSDGVRIQSDKGINFPMTDLGLPPLSDKDLSDLDFACAHADLIGFSFVEKLADMDYLIDELAKRSATDLPIIAKIETNRAVKNLPDIILGTLGRHSLGIMIARGDLAVELGSARLAEIQEELLWLCEAAHVPVIWATQVLESIAKKGVRSRPEFTDAAMAVRAECVMLNKGPYILDAIEALINVMDRMQAHQRKKFSRLRALHW